jgi:2-polyprenyl-3-methyl-5-hydroxy-6-metoxy-1,4-benzoquinol methylase
MEDFQLIISELIEASSQNETLSQFFTAPGAHQYLLLYRLVVRYIKAGCTVLDWGSGNGHFSYFLVRSGYKVHGFDFDDLPSVCRSLTPETYNYTMGQLASPASLPYENEKFDAVVSVGVLEHVRENGGNETAIVNEINRILKPGGIFLCYHLPNQYSWIDAVSRIVGRLFHKHFHKYRYTSSDILSLCGDAGLGIIEMKRYAVLPRNIWNLWKHKLKANNFSFKVARLYDRIDAFLSALLSPICQNYFFVARKKEPTFHDLNHRCRSLAESA